MSFQGIVDAIGEGGRLCRGDYHITLGQLIKGLKNADQALPVEIDLKNHDDSLYTPSSPHSYRGYYSDLAFERDSRIITVSKFLEMCEDCLDRDFEGYKGGQFIMDFRTPLWISEYSSCSDIAIVEFKETEEHFLLITKQLDKD